LKSSKKARTKHLAAGLLKKNLPSYHPAPLPIANSKQTKKELPNSYIKLLTYR